MSKLEELIKEKCPTGVEYLELYKVVKWNKRFSGVDKKCQPEILNTNSDVSAQLLKTLVVDNGNIKLLSTGNFDGYTDDVTYTGIIDENEVITIPSGGTANIKYYNGRFINSGNILGSSLDDEKYNLKYVYYCLTNKNELIQSFFRGSSVQHPDMKQIIQIRIPIPPLEVQEEIVKILDKFGELEARRSQYEFWRDKIFKFENRNDVQWLRLGDIKTDIYRGNGIKRDEVTKDGVPCVRYGEIYTSYNIWFDTCKSHTTEDVVRSPKTFSNNDLLFAITGESVEEISKTIAYTGNGTCYAGGDIVVMKHNQNGKYLSYALSTTDAVRQKGKGKVKSKVVHSSVPSIEEIIVPIVSLEEQEEIVKKLDDFYILINDFNYGLPAEIEARRKQYEYYRNKLLSFEEVSCE